MNTTLISAKVFSCLFSIHLTKKIDINILLARDFGIKKNEDDIQLVLSNFLLTEIKMIQAFPSTYCLLFNEVKVY